MTALQKHVLIVGGGVAGLTAAHELIERGYAVTVLESHSLLGGKSKSVTVPHTGTDGRADLPGEHGFRFFPGFYRHLPDTMSRIPYKDGTVRDNLVRAREIYISSDDHENIRTSGNIRGAISQISALISGRHYLQQAGISDEELEFFMQRIWQVLTSCKSRRDTELDTVSWWEFIDADAHSEAYHTALAINSTKTLIASDPKRASARTVGQLAIQVYEGLSHIRNDFDRILNGPTSDVWIDPWITYLRNKGVVFKAGYEATELHVSEGVLQEVVCQHTLTHTHESLTADYYILATPVEVSADLLAPLQKWDDQFTDIEALATMTNWMNGIQFYLRTDVPIARGHEMLSTTPWALTSISQAQFWTEADITRMGDGTVHGILSVDISDWHTKGILHQKCAIDCTPKEIAEEVWFQLKGALNQPHEILLEDTNLHSWFLDPDIQRARKNPHKNVNLEPLLVNLINSWKLRPLAVTKIKNFFLAADYVKNNTDLATMEGANEAARRAVNAILEVTGSTAKRCKVWPLHEPFFVWFLKWYDRYRFNRGLPWTAKPPFILRWPVSLLAIVYILMRKVVRLAFMHHKPL